MEPVIQVQNLVQKVGRQILLNDISFEVYAGEFFGVFGTRGAGKTTLLHILAGIDRFKAGKVEISGFDIRKSDQFKRDIGIVTQERSLFRDLTVAENLDFIAALKRASRKNVLEMIERFELSEDLSKPVTILDFSTFQRLSLACAMLNHPKILFLDEILKDLDPYTNHLILKELDRFKTEGGTCLFAYGNVELSPLMDRVGWLENGKMAIYQAESILQEWNRRTKFYTEPGERQYV